MAEVVKLGQPVVFRPGTAADERWGPGQFLSGMITNIQGDQASILVFPDAYPPYFEIRVARDDSLSVDRTWTPTTGENQTMPEAPSDGQIYGRRNQAWTPISGEDQGFIQSIVISDTEPKPALVGMAWFDTTINNFYVFEQGRWIEPGHVNPLVDAAVNREAPVISGTLAMGQTLSCTNGVWVSISPISNYSYQWYRGATPIAGQVTNQHVLSAADLGFDLACAVTATNDAGLSQPAFSNHISITPPLIFTNPIITGEVFIGGNLHCPTGVWANNPTSYTYQWYRDGVQIAGAINPDYVIVVADTALVLACAVTASNALGASQPAYSNNVPIRVPTLVHAPTISGGAYPGSTLMCTTGEWNSSPTTFAYGWRRSVFQAIGTNSSTYLVVAADMDTDIDCGVTATNGIGSAGPAISSNSIRIKHPTALDPATIATVALSNGNLTATTTLAFSGAGARSPAYKQAGKWCFSCVLTNLEGNDSGVGLLRSDATYDDMLRGDTSFVVSREKGTILADANLTGKTLGPLTDGQVLQFAINLDFNLYWVRKTGGFWNGDPTANPETGAGAINCFAALIDGVSPAVCFGGPNVALGENVTFNFGTSPLAFSIPGFDAGWSIGSGP